MFPERDMGSARKDEGTGNESREGSPKRRALWPGRGGHWPALDVSRVSYRERADECA